MAWNEPGPGKDPWSQGPKRGEQNPPDLDEMMKKIKARFGGGGGGTRKPGQGVGLPPGIAGLLILLVGVLWIASGFYVVDEQERLGRGLTVVRRMRLMTELREHGVAIFNSASDIRIAHNAVHFKDSSGAQMDLPVDHVVIAKGAHGDLTLADKLTAEGFTVHALGDATGVGYIEGAMRGAADAVAKVA